jgi:hypothetical protein
MIDDPELYELVKQYTDLVYKKPSAYKSGYIQRLYKSLNGTYSGKDNEPKKLKEWFDAKWINVAKKGQYPVMRPSVRINSSTPLTVDEIDKQNLKEQINLKQKIKGKKNLPPFKPKTI